MDKWIPPSLTLGIAGYFVFWNQDLLNFDDPLNVEASELFFKNKVRAPIAISFRMLFLHFDSLTNARRLLSLQIENSKFHAKSFHQSVINKLIPGEKIWPDTFPKNLYVQYK